jgi:CHASE2 domain-containing sensor protein
LRLNLKQKNILIETSPAGVEGIKLRPYSISTNPNGMLWIKFKEPNKDQYVSAVDILNNKFDKKKLEGKILLIGSSAQGLFDFVGVSNGKVIPGVEVHANIIENIIITKTTQNNIPFKILLLFFVTYELSFSSLNLSSGNFFNHNSTNFSSDKSS